MRGIQKSRRKETEKTLKGVFEMKEMMISYLQSMMDSFKAEEQKWGIEDRLVQKKLDAMIACNEMAEALSGEPVGLGVDGKVRVGF